MTDQTTDRHTCHNQKAAAGPAWQCPRCSATSPVPLPPGVQSPIREQLLNAIDATFCQTLGFGAPEGLLAAYEVSRTQTVDRDALRDRVAKALADEDARACGWGHEFLDRYGVDAETDGFVDALLAAVLPATTNHDTDTNVEPPLDPNYSHEACGFHWHGRDGMDIPMRDGQPACPRCELAKVQKKLDHTQKLRDEVGVECKRRGKRVLEQSERVIALERQVDELQRQLGVEILRAGQAEAELRRVADETAATDTQAATGACTNCRGSGLDPRYNGDFACPDCQPAPEPAAGARQDGAQP
ncbi:hypothetical protein [Streptomyces tendae]